MNGITITELADWTKELGFFGNVYIRQIDLLGQQKLPGHQHNFDHATFVGKGQVRVTIWYASGETTEATYDAPSWFAVPATAKHQIESLMDGATCFCVFAVRDPSGEITEFVTEAHRKDRFYHERRGGGDRGDSA